MVVKGDVKVESHGKITAAKIGLKVLPSDKVFTGKDSRAKIVMSDSNIINISPDTQMLIEKYVFNEKKDEKNVTLNILYGKVRSTVNQKYDGEKNKFQIKTPSAVAGVRGTDFLSQYSKTTNTAKFVTFAGQVQVNGLDKTGHMLTAVTVSPGQFTVAANGTVPAAPSTLPAGELAKMNQESKAEGSNDRNVANDKNKQTSPGSTNKGGGSSSGGDTNKKEGSGSDKPDKKDGSTNSSDRKPSAASPTQGQGMPSMLGDAHSEVPKDMPADILTPEPPRTIGDVYKPPEIPSDLLHQQTLLNVNVHLQ